MSGSRYSREFLDWLRKVAPGRTLARIHDLIRARWRMRLSDCQLKNVLRNHGIRRFEGMSHKEMCAITTVHEHKFPELKEWLLAQDVTGTTRAMMLERINAHFGWDMTMSQLKGYLNRNHLALWGIEAGQFRKGHPSTKGVKMSAEQYRKCAGTMFKKGNRPHTAVPVGTITVAKTMNGRKEELYYKKKVAEPNRWKLLHRLVWEEHNGPIPKNHVVTFLDGDWRNCGISNLMCISMGANCRANQDGLRFEGNPELTKSGLLVSELKTQAIKAEKKLRKGKRRKKTRRRKKLMTYDELITDMIDLKEVSYIDTVWQRIEYATDVVVTGRRKDGAKAFTRECTLSDFEMDVTVLAGVNRGLAETYRNHRLFNARHGVMAEVLKKPSLKELDFSWRLYGERREQHATREQMDRFIEAWYGKDDDSE